MSKLTRSLFVLAAFGLVFAWARPTQAETSYTNKELVKNGDFETQLASEWQSINGFPDGSEQAGPAIIWGTGAARSGTHSIWIGNQGAYVEAVRQVVNIPAGAKNIKISLWYEKWGNDYRSMLYMDVYSASGLSDWQVAPNDPVNNWAKLESTLPDGTSGDVTIDIVSYKGVHAYIDDVSVTADVPADTIAPFINITSPVNYSILNSPEATIKGSVSDSGSGVSSLVSYNHGVYVLIDTDANGAFTINLNLKQGANDYEFIASDNAGNTVNLVYRLTYQPLPVTPPADTTAPVITFTSPAHSSTVNQAVTLVRGTVIDYGSGVGELDRWVNDQKVLIAFDAQGNFQFEWPLMAGQNQIKLSAVDRSGNWANSYLMVIYKQPQVLGAAQAQAQLVNVATTRGTFVCGQTKIRPFSKYTGRMYVKKVIQGDQIFYVAATQDKGTAGRVKLFNSNCGLLQTIKPFGSFNPGYNVTMGVLPDTTRVFLAIAPKAWGTMASIFELRYEANERHSTLQFVNYAKLASKTSGNLLVKFRADTSGTTPSLSLATAIVGKKVMSKMWILDGSVGRPYGQFVRLKALDSAIKIKTGKISFKF